MVNTIGHFQLIFVVSFKTLNKFSTLIVQKLVIYHWMKLSMVSKIFLPNCWFYVVNQDLSMKLKRMLHLYSNVCCVHVLHHVVLLKSIVLTELHSTGFLVKLMLNSKNLLFILVKWLVLLLLNLLVNQLLK